jgi:ribosomal protein S18 acetylase RimI-like enzyme
VKKDNQDVFAIYGQEVRIPVSIEQFRRLPVNPAYNQEFLDGEMIVTERRDRNDCLLSLVEPTPWLVDDQDLTTVRLLTEGDWDALPGVMASAFGTRPPFGLLPTHAERVAAAVSLVEATRRHHFGRLIEQACVVAADRAGTGIVGAALLTRCTFTQLSGFRMSLGAEFIPWEPGIPPMAHLTWAFVAGGFAGRGVGTALLARAAEALRGLGYQDLASSFQESNVPSYMFHWSNGFRLLPRGDSRRLDRRERREEDMS